MKDREFRLFGGVSAIYGILFAFCLYKCMSGFANILWTICTVAYMVYIAKRLGKNWKIINTFLSFILVLLGVSNSVTGDIEIIFFNYVVIIVFVCINTLLLYDSTGQKQVLKSIGKLLETMIKIIGNFGKPFSHLSQYIKSTKNKNSEKSRYIMIGIFSAIPIVILVILILTSADSVFREGIRQILGFESIAANLIGIILFFIVGYMISYSVSLFLKQNEILVEGDGNKMAALPVTVVVTIVTVIYAIFSIVQIVYLFIGKGTLPDGYTYAQYAREGFFQLLFLSVVNVVAVLVCMELVEKNKALKITLYPLCLCTIIMALSSAYRMKMYIDEYGVTSLRIYVLWFLLVIILVLAGMILKLTFSKINLFQYCLIVCSICFLVLSFSHKDYFIAKYNFEKYDKMFDAEVELEKQNEENGENMEMYKYVDIDYLMSLSTDAAPVMVSYKREIEKYMKKEQLDWKDFGWCYIEYGSDGEVYNHIGVRNFNLSRWYSREYVKKMEK